MSKPLDLSTERREFSLGHLSREDLQDDPIRQFEQWLQVAKDETLKDATAMTLATVDSNGMPFQRMVLLKGLDQRGFVFFTNLESRKAHQLAGNQQCSLHFAWLPLDRQVVINGVARPLSKAENLRYFISRPRESQLAALASHQSHPVTGRRVLEEKFHELKARFADGDIGLPKFWGGYRIEPSAIEFWQGGEYRLHDRFLYTRQGESHWEIERLSP